MKRKYAHSRVISPETPASPPEDIDLDLIAVGGHLLGPFPEETTIRTLSFLGVRAITHAEDDASIKVIIIDFGNNLIAIEGDARTEAGENLLLVAIYVV